MEGDEEYSNFYLGNMSDVIGYSLSFVLWSCFLAFCV